MKSGGDFRRLDIKNFYSAPGNVILDEFVKPVLLNSVAYDRLTGYFSVNALVSVAQGLETLFRRKGKMRLVIGIHDVPVDLVAAWQMGNLLPDDLVSECKKRLMNEVGFLEEQVEKNAITTIGWMMKLGLLEVRVAAPQKSKGIYHQKRMIFRDSLGNTIAGTGSLNETQGGQENIEEMHFTFSWNSGSKMVDPLTDSFEKIWSGQDESVEIHQLDESFATQLLKTLGNPKNPLDDDNFNDQKGSNVLNEVWRLSLDSPIFAPMNIANAALYPHQERVYAESLNRWPVRVLMADEVGLGKTLEAGSVISYMHRIQGIEKITILAPAGLMSQWQDEMIKHFNLVFWKWNSSNKEFEFKDKIWSNDKKEQQGLPALQLISAQWARLNPDEFVNNLPQLLLVDEAHAARVQIDAYGNQKATLLWRLLDEVKERIPHIVLMSATPMQIHPGEYHSLLKILGLMNPWDKYQTYEKSLHIIAKSNPKPNFQDASDLANLVLSAYQSYEWLPSVLSEGDFNLILELVGLSEAPIFDRANIVLKNYETFRLVLMKIHPANFLTCRNTKSGLEEFGYKFPRRNFISPSVAMSAQHARFEAHLEDYLTNRYGRTEQTIRPDDSFPIGFAKSNYYQRLVSSLPAAHRSLIKRREKLTLIQNEIESGNYELISQYFNVLIDEDVELDENFEKFDGFAVDKKKLAITLAQVKYEISLEIQTISDLVRDLESLGDNLDEVDPKFSEAMKFLTNRLKVAPVLVFSRYTDTLFGFLRLFSKSELSKRLDGYALYTGEEVWISKYGSQAAATKNDVTAALENGEIKVVFCSDAASEGLNLQEAQTIINLDVPWNPARLEQRIGRIARLGQRADEVEIVNLWYPRSVEAQMYRKLLERRDEYQIAVGEFPEIFGTAIKKAVADKLSNLDLPNDPIAELNSMRQNFQRVALEALWQKSPKHMPPSKLNRERLVQFIEAAKSVSPERLSTHIFTSEAGRRGSVTLTSRALQAATEVDFNQMTDGFWVEFGIFGTESKPLLFAVCNSSSNFRILKSNSLGKLLLACIGVDSLAEEDFSTLEFSEKRMEWAVQEAINLEYLVPTHISGVKSTKVEVSNPTKVDLKALIYRAIGKVKMGAN